MSTFLNIGLRNAERGFRVFPVRRGDKRPLIREFPELATTDTAQIEAWAEAFPDANCGVMGDDTFLILDTDRWDKLQEVLGPQLAVDPSLFDTYCISARENRRQFAFLQTDKSRAMRKRNLDYAVPGEADNVFEFKSSRKFGMGEGSVHKSGSTYAIVQDLPFKPVPDLLIDRAEELATIKPARDAETEARFIAHGEQHNELVRLAGVMRQGGFAPAEILAALEVTAGTRCEDSIPQGNLERIAEDAGKWPIGTHVSVITVSQTAAPVEKRARPVYPIEIWDGTAVGEFARVCAEDNHIPRKLFAESFRTVLGAVMGNRLSCPVDGAIPRTYTIIIAPFGKGKGTAIRRATRFFSQPWYGNATCPGLLSGARDFIWKSQGIGAWNASASSVPGMARLAKDDEDTVKNSPHMAWGNTLPRILSVHEEMKTFFSTLFIENGVGTGMDGVVCQLWDDLEFNGTATGTRDALYGQMMFSLLGGVTPDDWFDLISRGNAVGGGLMSRLNLIGTEGNYENVPKMRQPEFTPLQESFLPRIKLLSDAPVRVNSLEEAERVMAEWADTLPEGSERMNVQAWRAALLLAWLRREDVITAKTAEDAVRLGRYQVESQDFYRVMAADTQAAKIQAKILRTLKMKGEASRRELQRATHAHRCGTDLWNKALEGLVRDLAVGRRDDVYFLVD